MLQSWRAEAGQVIPFAPTSGRGRAPAESEGERADPRRGIVLLFTGVRYERMSDQGPDEIEGVALEAAAPISA